MSTFLYINQPFGYFLCEISCPVSFSLSVFICSSCLFCGYKSSDFFSAVPHSLPDLYSPIRDWTYALVNGISSSNHWTAREFSLCWFCVANIVSYSVCWFFGFCFFFFFFFFGFYSLYFLMNRGSDFHVVQFITLYLWLVFLFVLSVKLLSTSKS